MADSTCASNCVEVPCTVAGIVFIIFITIAILPVQKPTYYIEDGCSSETYNASRNVSGVEVEGNASSAQTGSELSCVELQNDGRDQMSFCEPTSCVRKCCLLNQSFSSATDWSCIDAELEAPFLPVFISTLNETVRMNTSNPNFHIEYGNPCEWFQLPVLRNDTRLLPDGRAIAADNDTWIPEDYCFERFLGENTMHALVCNYDGVKEEILFVVRTLSDIICFMCYLATFLVYALIPVLHSTFQGKAVMYHVLCMVLQTVTASIANNLFFLPSVKRMSLICVIFVYYAVMSSFSWLTVMSFDIWHNFRTLRPMPSSVKERRRRRHLMYSTFAWGYAPVCLILVAIGEVRRYLDTFALYLPVNLLMFVNAMMFFTTWCRLRALDRSSVAFESEDSRIHDANRKRYTVYVNVFLIMAAPWVIKMFQLIEEFGHSFLLNVAVPVVVGLQGVLVLCIFTCKRRVVRLIKLAISPTRHPQ